MTRIPTLHVEADSIPLAYYRAMRKVWENGMRIRTEYDRKNKDGGFIDPPSRDARLLIEVMDPFSEPRYTPVSFCEIGAYIAEIMGAKDHYVIPMEELKKGIGGKLSAHEWPYTYHQRMFNHPDINGDTIDQVELAIERMIKTPHSRRAMITTSVPNVDAFLTEDVPCLREIQLRCPQNYDGSLVLNMSTSWRSRDLYKAWSDNVIALTYLQKNIAKRIEEESGLKCFVGSYADWSMSAHIYGQDFDAVGGNSDQSISSFFDNLDEKTIIQKSMSSKDAHEMLIVPQLQDLLTEKKIKEWKFDESAIKIIEKLIKEFSD